MKKIKYNKFIVALVLIALFLTSCNREGNYKGKAVGKTANIDSIVAVSKTKPLAELYYEHGNFVNTKDFPPIVNATKVFKHQNDWLLIDIRNATDYAKGHIRGAYNVQKDRLIDYLTQTRNADAYEKVVIIDNDGQLAAYVTGILRYAGFDNVFMLYYGMAAWNSKFSEPLKKGYKKGYDQFIEKAVETNKEESHKEHTKNNKSLDELIKEVPKLADSLPTSLIEQHARALLKQEPQVILVTSDAFFKAYKENPNKYLPVFYMDNEKKFKEAHIKGAALYKSRKDLSLNTKLTQLPKDKQIVLYCKTGHTSGVAAAYLNMLGYKAKSLTFGFNSYEGDAKVVEDYINDYPVIEGKSPFEIKKTKKKK